LTWGS